MACVQYLEGDETRLMLESAGTWYTVGGLNSLTIPGLERGTTPVEEFGLKTKFNISTQINARTLDASGNMLIGDTGQNVIRAGILAKTKFTDDVRAFIGYGSGIFVAPDLAKDPCSAWTFDMLTYGAADTNNLYTVTIRAQIKGLVVRVEYQIGGTTLAFVTGSPATITDSGNGFIDAGFKDGDTIIIEGSTSNDGFYEIATAAAGTLTLRTGDVLASETALAGSLIFGGTGGE